MKFLRSFRKSNQSDEELIRSYKTGADPVCLEILFDRYCHLAFAVALRYLHDEDECQDVVLSIFERLGRDLKKYEIRKFSTWLHSVVRNECFQKIRGRKEFPLFEHHPLISNDDPDEKTELQKKEKLLNQLEAGLLLLNKEQQSCLRLFFLEEKSYEEISALTGFTYKQVKSFIQNGKRNLRIYVEKQP